MSRRRARSNSKSPKQPFIHPFDIDDILRTIACFLFIKPLTSLDNVLVEYNANKEAECWDHGFLMTLRLSSVTKRARFILAAFCFTQGELIRARFCDEPLHKFSLNYCHFCDTSPVAVFCRLCVPECVWCEIVSCDDCAEFADFRKCYGCNVFYCQYCAIDARRLSRDGSVCAECGPVTTIDSSSSFDEEEMNISMEYDTDTTSTIDDSL
jgi:hypothetical protein